MNKVSLTPFAKNYIPGSVAWSDFLTGMTRSAGKTIWMAVDEKKACKIIKALLKKGKKIERATLGLDGDWVENSSVIYDGKNFSTYDAYEGSKWAAPILIINYINEPSEAFECWMPEE